MNDIFSYILAMDIGETALSGENAIPFIILISIFVSGLLLLQSVTQISKRLIISSFTSYAIMLFIVLFLYFGTKYFDDAFPSSILLQAITLICILVILPNFLFFNFMESLIGTGFTWYYSQYPIFFQTMLYLMTFFMNILYIFWILRLILFIKHKISSKEPQVK
jgi:hypothetical protein